MRASSLLRTASARCGALARAALGAVSGLCTRLALRLRHRPIGGPVGLVGPAGPAGSGAAAGAQASPTGCSSLSEADVVRELENALETGRIVPFFQPQVEAATGQLVGFEALVRWRHPTRGLLLPAAFLAEAEEAGLAPRLTARMLRLSLGALAAWRDEQLEVPRVSINFTAAELRDRDLASVLAFELDMAGLAPQDLVIEVVESALTREPDDPIPANLAGLSAAGFGIDLDDFGKGTAVLADLERLDVDRVKIDRSLLADLRLHPRRRTTIRAIVDTAHGRGLRVVGEGVESEEDWRLLARLGCDDLQGFAIGRPMRGADVPSWLGGRRRRKLARGIIAAA